MGWAVGNLEGRHIGYGVPAKCDHPDCAEDIHRGLSFRCGDLSDEGCNRFLCTDHLTCWIDLEDDGRGVSVCERCERDEPPFDPSPDTPEWAQHVLTDESWAQWRDENPDQVDAMRRIVAEESTC